MPHPHIVRKIPPLDKALVSFAGFPPGRSKQSLVLIELRKLARKFQRTNPESFYSMREVAVFFSLPLRTVALAYEALEQEGLLIRLRGAQTKLAGKKVAARDHVLGVVGLPIWLSSIASSPYMRALHIDLNERLRRHGFVIDSIFFNACEDRQPEFAERLQAHRLDWIIWFGANFRSSSIFMALRDRGIRQIVVLPEETPLTIPLPVYLQDWDKAYRALAADWARAGIKRVMIPHPADSLVTQRVSRHFSTVMKAHKITIDVAEAHHPGSFAEAAHRACARGRTAVAFLEMESARDVCNGYPQLMADVARTTRLGFCRGPVIVPFFSQESVIADVVGCDPVEISKRIVTDLASQAALPNAIGARFDALYHPRTNFSIYRDASDVTPAALKRLG